VSFIYFADFIKLREIRIVRKFLKPERGERVVDIACGWGVYNIYIAKKGCQVFELDRSQRALKLANVISKGYDCSQQIGDATALPYRSNVFDKCTCICALEHFIDDQKALTEMNRVLKLGGILILTVDSFTYRGISDDIKERHARVCHVVNYYTYPLLEDKLRKAGFSVEEKMFLFNSPISSFFYSLAIKLQFGYCVKLLFPIAYGLTILDRFWKRNNEGYHLVIKARKASAVA